MELIMKKLPDLYKNKINKPINNNKEYCYLKDEIIDKSNIINTIKNIFSGIGYSYNIPVTIKTKDKEYNTSLVAKTKNSVITLEDEIINIDDIIFIKTN